MRGARIHFLRIPPPGALMAIRQFPRPRGAFGDSAIEGGYLRKFQVGCFISLGGGLITISDNDLCGSACEMIQFSSIPKVRSWLVAAEEEAEATTALCHIV